MSLPITLVRMVTLHKGNLIWNRTKNLRRKKEYKNSKVNRLPSHFLLLVWAIWAYRGVLHSKTCDKYGHRRNDCRSSTYCHEGVHLEKNCWKKNQQEINLRYRKKEREKSKKIRNVLAIGMETRLKRNDELG